MIESHNSMKQSGGLSLCAKVSTAEYNVPEAFDMKISQLVDLKENSNNLVELACMAFRFGFKQGKRAECVRRKAGVISNATN